MPQPVSRSRQGFVVLGLHKGDSLSRLVHTRRPVVQLASLLRRLLHVAVLLQPFRQYLLDQRCHRAVVILRRFLSSFLEVGFDPNPYASSACHCLTISIIDSCQLSYNVDSVPPSLLADCQHRKQLWPTAPTPSAPSRCSNRHRWWPGCSTRRSIQHRPSWSALPATPAMSRMPASWHRQCC